METIIQGEKQQDLSHQDKVNLLKTYIDNQHKLIDLYKEVLQLQGTQQHQEHQQEDDEEETTK